MSYSPTELKAIRLWADSNDAVPQLSVYPVVRFKIRGTDEIKDQHIMVLVSDYNEHHKEEVKEKARLKRQLTK